MRARLPLVLAVLATLALGLVGSPPSARADGDPASDVLLVNQLYTPVAQRISPPVLKQLKDTIRSADASGFKIRVALILDRTDLGAVPQLLGHPKEYVQLLSSELIYGWTGALIAVEPSGIGVRNVKPLAPAQRIVDGIAVPKPASSDGLARAATTAIRKLAAANGHTLGTSAAAPSTSSSSSSSTLLLAIGGAVIGVVVVLIAGWLVLRRRRRQPRLAERRLQAGTRPRARRRSRMRAPAGPRRAGAPTSLIRSPDPRGGRRTAPRPSA